MRQFKIFSIFIILALLSSCGKDDYMEPGNPDIVVNEAISGSAMMDLDGDGIGDSPLTGSTIYLADSIYKTYDPDTFGQPEVLSTIVDADGLYLFDGVPPTQGKALFFVMNPNQGNPINFEIVGVDTEVDGDARETDLGEKIYIDLETDEQDNGNDFVVTRHPISISGSVLLDADLDGVGEEGLQGYGVKLYTRLANGMPSTDLVAQTWTSTFGIFDFYNVDPGEYVLEILNNGPSYYILSSGDETPDPDGIGNPNLPHLIPVDLEMDEVDTDNNYILRNNLVGTISGRVGDDLDLDGVMDFGLRQIWVGLFSDVTGNMINNAFTDEFGAFSFNNLPGDYYLQVLDSDDYLFQAVGDFSDDGDPSDLDIGQSNGIKVTLGQNEQDEDNDFHITIESGRISGRVLDDTDGDGIGDTPVFNDVVLLSFRGAQGAPISNPAWPWNEEVTYTDVNGYYKFDIGIPDTGEFVINHIGSGAAPFDCISSEDLSPESGEPQNQHSYCSLIQCDLLDVNSEDHHNNYVIDIQ